MNQTELAQRVKLIQKSANVLVHEARILEERRHLLESIINSDLAASTTGGKFGLVYGVNTYKHLVPLLLHDIVSSLIRLVLDKDRRVTSMVGIYSKASDKLILEALRAEFTKVANQYHHNKNQNNLRDDIQSQLSREQGRLADLDVLRASFDSGWDRVTKAVFGLYIDPVGVKLKEFRDQYQNDLLTVPSDMEPALFDPKSFGLSIDKILDFADRYLDPISELVRILTGNKFDVQLLRNRRHLSIQSHKQNPQDMTKKTQ